MTTNKRTRKYELSNSCCPASLETQETYKEERPWSILKVLEIFYDYILWISLILFVHANNSRALLEKKVGYGEALAYQWPRLLGACAVFTVLFVIVKKYRKPGSKPPRFGFNLETVADMGTLLAFCFAVGVIGAF